MQNVHMLKRASSHRASLPDKIPIEINAEIRNSLQPAITALELLKEGKAVPSAFMDIAIRELSLIVKKLY